MKSVLIIGNINSTFVIGLINNLKSYDPSLRVDCLCTLPIERHKAKPDNIYTNPICEWWKAKFGKKVRYGWLLGVLSWFFFRKNRTYYDNIQIHYVDILHHLAAPIYRLCTEKLTAVIWGSDLFRCSTPSMLSAILNRCDGINCHTPKMKEKLQSLLSEKRRKVTSFSNCLFGLLPLQHIAKLKKQQISKQTCCSSLGFPANKKIVLLGYSANPIHQHIAVINQLTQIQDQLQDVFFILPFTYGKYPSHLIQTKSLLAASSLNYQILETYLSDEDIAKLRLCIDVSIIVPISDAASGTVLESLYSGSHLITGKWLDYSKLERAGVEFTKIENIDQINTTLLEMLATPRPEQNNEKIIASFSDWTVLIQDWHSLIVDNDSAHYKFREQK
ncbi:MAG: hypothetical protein HWD84_07945 [Flavobacteriaceae bacterium]|nr:hypothetical protein [Flavobacteriaceae bacterium]